MTTDATVLPEEDESLEPASSSVKAIVGSTLTFIAMVVLWEVLVVQPPAEPVALLVARRVAPVVGIDEVDEPAVHPYFLDFIEWHVETPCKSARLGLG